MHELSGQSDRIKDDSIFPPGSVDCVSSVFFCTLWISQCEREGISGFTDVGAISIIIIIVIIKRTQFQFPHKSERDKKTNIRSPTRKEMTLCWLQPGVKSVIFHRHELEIIITVISEIMIIIDRDALYGILYKWSY